MRYNILRFEGKMTNILDAFITLKNSSAYTLGAGEGGNSIQLVGSSLEAFVSNLFSNSLDPNIDTQARTERHNEAFSYLGAANQPPDAILKSGDAIEVKKVDSLNGSIQLNSSPPKAKLLSTDTRINNTVKELAERGGWTEKDIFYAVGSQSNNQLKRLWFIYGDCYAASHDTYERINNRVKQSIASGFDKIELADTNEIAGIPGVDPLKITHLRVRGMWIIKNPSVVFSDFIEDKEAEFKAYCILKKDKYYSFSQESRDKFEQALDDKLSISDIKIPHPDNPAEIIEARLIKYEI
jgi:hypothetical protein